MYLEVLREKKTGVGLWRLDLAYSVGRQVAVEAGNLLWYRIPHDFDQLTTKVSAFLRDLLRCLFTEGHYEFVELKRNLRFYMSGTKKI